MFGLVKPLLASVRAIPHSSTSLIVGNFLKIHVDSRLPNIMNKADKITDFLHTPCRSDRDLTGLYQLYGPLHNLAP
jgi:hypothetical protein